MDVGAAGEAALFAGERLALRRLVVGVGERLRVEGAEGEERVLVPVGGELVLRVDQLRTDAPGQRFGPGQVGVLRSGEWCELTGRTGEAVVLEVCAPEPTRRP